MKLGLVINTNNPEKAWNAFRLAVTSKLSGHEVKVFLLGAGVEVENIRDEKFNVREQLEKFLEVGGEILVCGTCLKIRQQEEGVCPVSTMKDLVNLIEKSDKVLVIG